MVDTDLGQSANSSGHLLCAKLDVGPGWHSGVSITMRQQAVVCGGLRHHARRAHIQVLVLGSPSCLRFNFLSEG